MNESKSRSTSVNLILDYKISQKWKFLHQSNIMISDANGFSAFDERSYLAANLRTWNYGETPSELVFNSSDLPSGGIANINQMSSTAWGVRNSLDFATPLFDNRDQLNFTIGSEFNSEKFDGYSATEPGYFPDRGKTFLRRMLSAESTAGSI